MSSLDHNDIAVLVRRRTGASPSDSLRFIPLVNNAILRTVHKCAYYPKLRHWVLTDKSTTTASLDGSGIADLSSLITDPRILIELFIYGQVYHSSNDYPLRMLTSVSQGKLQGAFDGLFLHYWLEGTSLYTRSSDNNATPLSGDLSFAVPFWQTLSALPEPLVEMPKVGLVESVIELLEENKAEYEQESVA